MAVTKCLLSLKTSFDKIFFFFFFSVRIHVILTASVTVAINIHTNFLLAIKGDSAFSLLFVLFCKEEKLHLVISFYCSVVCKTSKCIYSVILRFCMLSSLNMK